MSSRHTLQNYLDSWLQSWSFKGHPFRYWEAHNEVHIDEYYVKHRFYEQLLISSNPTIIFAYRGEGKTATRIMLQRECQPQKPTSNAFAIPFSDFSFLLEEKYLKNHKVTFSDYLPLLIHEGLLSLLCTCTFLLRDNIEITIKELSQFKFWIESYAPTILEEQHVDSILKEIWKRSTKAEIDSSKIDSWRKFIQSNSPNHYNLPDNDSLFWEKFFILWFSLRKSKPFGYKDWRIAESTSKVVMQGFVRFAQDILSKGKYPCQHIIFLYDGIDEYDATRGDPEVSSKVLSPLLWEMWFHRIDGLNNKFFLPKEQKSRFVSADTRWDLFEIFDLDWQNNNSEISEIGAMKKLLRERIFYFNLEGKNTLTHMCEPEIGRFIEDEMIAEADKSPRNLIRLGSMLFSEHCEIDPDPKSLITLTEWENTLRKYRASIHMARREENTNQTKNVISKKTSMNPKLIIKQAARKVYKGSEEIVLSATEFDLLLELNRKIGQICSEEELLEALYKQGFSKKLANSLRSHIRHLRNKIEPKGQSGYYYIKNVRGRGYVLENVEN